MAELLHNIEISEGIYWVGDYTKEGSLACNPYLIVDNGEGVLIDPGSVLDFEAVYENVTKLISIDKIKYIVLQHQDPDLCSSTPLFESRGFRGKIATHWRGSVLIKYYGVKSEFYVVNENNFELVLSSGRCLKFIHTPYLHFPGAIVTYDVKTKVLFSSDLFGSLSKKMQLYADETYIEGMKAFHENYMPSNDIIRPVMEKFLIMDIKIIASQHGSIIKDNVKKFIVTLRDLDCGIYLNPIKRELAKNGGYLSICNQVLKRLYSIYNTNEIKEIFMNDKDIEIDEETYLIKDFNLTGEELWNKLFVTTQVKISLQTN